MSPLDRSNVVEMYRHHVNRGMAITAGLTQMPLERRTEGPYVFDDDGVKYLQCGGVGVFLLGHCHPDVVGAVVRQVQTLPLSSRAMLTEETAAAATALAEVCPDGLEYVYFGTSGAEATETALKLARTHGKHQIIAMEGGYHGKSIGALSVTGKDVYRKPFEPLLDGIRFVPFGDPAALEQELERAGQSACVILEPVQGEGGVRVPPDGYLREVERLCRAVDAFLILDEIQTGLGRLGAWWGASIHGVVPDILLAGKILSGGVVPISAVVASEGAFSKVNRDPVLHTATFSGAPLAAVAARTTIEVIKRDGLVERSRVLGERTLDGIRERLAGRRSVKDVRGRGLMIGIEFAEPFLAGEFLLEMIKRRVLVVYSFNAQEVIRISPPAVITEYDLTWLLDAIAESAEAVDALYERTSTPVIA